MARHSKGLRKSLGDMKNAFDHLIIIGRPACGKTEFIDFIKHKMTDEERLEKFHIAPFEEIDDFPWLWEKCVEDDMWEKVGARRIVSKISEHAYTVTNHDFWNFLIEKFNHTIEMKYLCNLSFYEKKTLLIEFSRGRKDAYKNALNYFSEHVLERSAIFHIRVSFEESMRRNEARYQEKLKHSLLAHKVPDEQMRDYYRVDDWDELTDGKTDGYLILNGAKVPYVTMGNEPESTDSSILKPRYGSSLNRLWELYRDR